MRDHDWLAARFDEHRAHLRAVAHRILGSAAEADDALQEAWLRARAADAGEVDNVGGWLTTIVSRVCLNMLRSRGTRREEALDRYEPDAAMVLAPDDAVDPEHEALMADSVGLALQVVLETLTPAERLAFVLHDMFAVPFEEVAPIVGHSTAAARQLASRARRRVRGADLSPRADRARRRRVVDAFTAAARHGDFDALLTVLDPEVVLRVETGSAPVRVERGATAVAGQATRFRLGGPAAEVHPVLVDGASGLLVVKDGRPYSVMAFSVTDDRVTEIAVVSDPERIGGLRPPASG
ncbi:RNA polymerase sigma-70 factor (ECF subfamily) [Nocardiopsis sp. Huas11]|uniref:sigma-70 family RNA polymerase sigma factor n=1 Tax=Nocardiopsis sp. Huas11 TaxID=2183912 RepID=UPI000EAF624A|nr:sigma-70 family RNA polymerase sigma factor [Nocardiopsis sp. Huas11]RKS05845.1 RNA polymerase sigma-70 factor (ECF subfamily) [Nocardiopsis sp. Huas11]